MSYLAVAALMLSLLWSLVPRNRQRRLRGSIEYAAMVMSEALSAPENSIPKGLLRPSE